ncbi:MAG: DUF305 domain-containing protein [Microgenomates group bacterium]
MKNENAKLYGIIGFLAGIVLTVFFSSNAVNTNNTSMMRMMGMHTQNSTTEKRMVEKEHGMGMGSSMDEMMDSMNVKEGDDFDKAFIEAMIPHHQGAIEMAKVAQTKASHDEIKKMADDIISAQSSEIEMMKQWQKDWGY